MSPIPELSDKANWESVAHDYSTHFTPLTLPFAHDVVNVLASHLLTPTTSVVLDVACGGGAFALAYLARFPRGIAGQTVRSTDFSPAMVDAARAAVDNALDGRVCETTFEFAVEDATKLEGVSDGSVQAVVSVFGIYLVPDKAQVMRQVQRVLSKEVPSAFSMATWTIPPSSLTDDLAQGQDSFGLLMQSAIGKAMKIFHPVDYVATVEQSKDSQKNKGTDVSEDKKLIIDSGLCRFVAQKSIHTQCVGNKHCLWMTMSVGNPLVDSSQMVEKDDSEMKEKYMDAIGNPGDDEAVFLIAAAYILKAWQQHN